MIIATLDYSLFKWYSKYDIIILMKREDKIIRTVESNFALEGMKFSGREKKIMQDCLSGRTTFDSAIKKAVARYKRA